MLLLIFVPVSLRIEEAVKLVGYNEAGLPVKPMQSSAITDVELLLNRNILPSI